jgi:ATP-dependent DNA helicase RecQ
MILDYFGDEADVHGCRCDVCRRGEDVAMGEQVVVSDELVLLVKQLLSAIARLHGKFGVGMVAEVLAGTQNEKTERWGFDKLTVFGLLRIHGVKRIIAMLHRLMEAGLARQRDPDGVKFRPVVELTAAGVAVMKGEQLPPASLEDILPRRGSRASGTNPRALGTNPKALRAAANGNESGPRIVRDVADDGMPVELSADAIRRFERLRAARTELARERQLPPYVICHDRTLKLIAHFAPTDAESLEQVKGMGPHKVKAYGEVLLSAMREP